MEPVLMALGQAAGIAASLAVHRGLAVHNVPIRELKNKQDIYPYGGWPSGGAGRVRRL